jgi:formylglycine-generating enzyme required for sulfatase activity
VQDIRTHHPKIEKLAAFGVGRLSEADSQEIELHLADCEACRQKLADVPDDALVHLLQGSGSLGPVPASDTQAALSASTDTDAATRTGESALPSDIKVAPPAFTIPRELQGHARYLVFGSLGAGGMGTVYKARHRLMDRVVALKIVNPILVNKPGAVERFKREVRAAAQLVHPNIVTAYDAESVGDLQLLVMEYVEGQTLAQLLAVEHVLPIAMACEYLRQTALGLQHALEHGMVHRDIKPQNLMLVRQETVSGSRLSTLDSRPVVKILDFGLARFVSEQGQTEGATLDGTLIGSPDYMAPEQGQDAHSADARADIYGMGCTLYHLLAGQVPFSTAPLLLKLEAHRDTQPKQLHDVRPAVPLELAKVVSKMMAKDPAQRYQTPGEVALALRPFTQVEPASPAKAQERSSKRGPKTLIALALGFIAISILAWQIVIRLTDEKGKVREVTVKEGEKIEIIPDPNKKEPTVGDPKTAGLTPPRVIAPFTAEEAKAHQEAWANYLNTQVETTNSVGAKMILIPPGEFLMGSTDEQVEAALKLAEELNTKQAAKDRIQNAERPQHRVVVTKPFFMGATEVTIGQFKKFTQATGYRTDAEKEELDVSFLSPGYPVTDDSPAAVIKWHEAVAYCAWLSEQEKFTYRLPTEAEWEYACRSGTSTHYSFGDDQAELGQYGWYSRNADSKAHPVGTRLPNAFGLFDMHGNLREWCHDIWREKAYETPSLEDPVGPRSGSYHVIRGGAWNSSPSYSRSAFRSTSIRETNRSDNLGFRCVRDW